MVTKAELKEFFESGDEPNQDQFEALIDACFNEPLFMLQVPEGDNLFNIDDPDVATGFFVNEGNGNLNVNSSHNSTGFIPVEGGQSYFASRTNRFAWYDDGQQFISGQRLTANNQFIIAPQNASFLRVSLDDTDTAWPILMVTPSNNQIYPFRPWTGDLSLPSSLVPGISQNREVISQNSSDIANIRLITDNVFTISSNLFNIDDPNVTQGRFINEGNGNLNVNSAHAATHFIPVEGNKDYYLSSVDRLAWYDSNMSYISGERSSVNQKVSPVNAAFLRFSVNPINRLENLTVAQSDSAVPHEAFGAISNNSSSDNESTESIYSILANMNNKLTWNLPNNVLYIGDSLSNGSADIAARSIFHSGIQGNFSRSVAGSTLAQIPAVMQGFDTSPYDTIVIGRVTNDVAGGASFEVIRQRILQTLAYFQNFQIVVMTCPPLDNLDNYGEGIQSTIDRINDWLLQLFVETGSKRVYDLNATWDADNDNQLDPQFVATVGNIHPNDAGYDAGGAGLAQVLTSA